MNAAEVERALRTLETHIAFLRRHCAEVLDRPNKDHRDQAIATLNRIEEATYLIGTNLTAR